MGEQRTLCISFRTNIYFCVDNGTYDIYRYTNTSMYVGIMYNAFQYNVYSCKLTYTCGCAFCIIFRRAFQLKNKNEKKNSQTLMYGIYAMPTNGRMVGRKQRQFYENYAPMSITYLYRYFKLCTFIICICICIMQVRQYILPVMPIAS